MALTQSIIESTEPAFDFATEFDHLLIALRTPDGINKGGRKYIKRQDDLYNFTCTGWLEGELQEPTSVVLKADPVDGSDKDFHAHIHSTPDGITIINYYDRRDWGLSSFDGIHPIADQSVREAETAKMIHRFLAAPDPAKINSAVQAEI